jgi:ABC-type branched-subunit amino acid transport system ATPase component
MVYRAYGKKHGHHAWLERHQLQEQRRAEAQELEEDRQREAEIRRRILDPQIQI